MAILSPSSSNLASKSVHKFSGESFIHPPTVDRRFRRSLSMSAAYTSVAPDREAAVLSRSSSLKTATSFYEVLGIPIGATSQEVKSAYRQLARIFHPDVATVDRRSDCAEDFMKIHFAYNTLSDPDKRTKYDRQVFMQNRRTGLYSVGSPAVSRYSGYAGRNWETDQCW